MSDQVCILWPEACRRLEREGWFVEYTDQGATIRNGKLVQELHDQDSLGSLVGRDDVDDAVWTLRRAKNNRKR